MTLPAMLPKKKRRELRLRSPAHRAWVRRHVCVVPDCISTNIECAHVRTAANSGTGLKPDDSETVSLCHTHHAESHQIGIHTFGAKYRLNLAEIAAEMWAKSPHGERKQRRSA